jgi:hypothetical protein
MWHGECPCVHAVLSFKYAGIDPDKEGIYVRKQYIRVRLRAQIQMYEDIS